MPRVYLLPASGPVTTVACCQKPPVPLVLRDIGRLGLALIALVLIVRGFFPEVNLNVFAVSSLVIGYIVGNATQDTLGNLFAGLALNAERPFQIADGITRTRGRWFPFKSGDRDIRVMPTFHPAFLLRQYTPDNRAKVWSDLQEVMKEMAAKE